MNESAKKKKKKRRSRSAARKSLKSLLPYLPFVAPIVITLFIYMWLHTRMNIIGMPTKRLRDQKKELIKQNDYLLLRIEELQAPARIEAIARRKLGMITPQEYRLVALDEPMQPPEGVSAGPRPEENKMQANTGSEGSEAVSNTNASEQVARQSG